MPQLNPNYDRGSLLRVIIDALMYADIGLRVVPLAKNSKHPIIERWQERGTTDYETIIGWFDSWPDANLGILTGQGIIAIDIDRRSDGDRNWRRLVGKRRLPRTAKALTGSGGTHLLFRVDPSVRIPTKINLRPGVDLIGENNVLVVEPSTHPRTKKEYVWLECPWHGIADAPAWLLRELPPPPREQRAKGAHPLRCVRTGDENELLNQIISRFPITHLGQRHQQMSRAIGSLLGRGYTTELVQSILGDWHVHFLELGLTDTNWQQAEKEVVSCIRSTLRNPRFATAVSGIEHRDKIAQLSLSEEQEKRIENGLIEHGVLYVPGPNASPPCNRLTSQPVRLCRSNRDRAFVRAFTAYMTYKVFQLREHPPKATLKQLAQLIEEQSGLRFVSVQLERMCLKYISRPSKPAERFELAIQTVKGRPGVPSEFHLTGILQVMAGPDGKHNPKARAGPPIAG